LSWAIGAATFAVNRRNNPEGQVPRLKRQNALKGPVDHDVPVLFVHEISPPQTGAGQGGGNSSLRAVVAGYACHATVLSGYEISADWPGAFQNEFERRHPGALALFWAGCGADQNPLPRRSVALMNKYGGELADAVEMAASLRSQIRRGEDADGIVGGNSLKPIPATLQTSYKEIDLPFATLPTRAELQAEAAGVPPRSRWAKYLLAKWDREGEPPATYPYPIQAWRLGPDLTWVFLGGEVVVDYSLRIKSDLGAKNTWIASYANDVMGYIPSRRVLAEGGYEGGEARIPYGLPAVWDPKVEQQIIDAVQDVAGHLSTGVNQE
jgi:hypothetical protein